MKKTLKILIYVFIIMGVLTGCDKNSTTDNEKTNNNDSNNNVNNTESIANNLTLENFKKVMKEQGLNVIDGKCDENSINCSYTATDNREQRRTTYIFTTYKDEDAATKFWQLNLNNLTESYTITIKDEEKRQLEYYYGNEGIVTKIYYYGTTTSLSVTNDDSDNKDSLKYVKEVLATLGYDSTSNINDSNDKTTETNTSTKNNNSNDNYYVGTYYMKLLDGTIAKDGTGTIILNKDKSCAYYYGWSDFGCKSYTVKDHLICLKTTENQDDVCFTLTASNDMLIDANNDKYIKE